jgi:hypothetical protein
VLSGTWRGIPVLEFDYWYYTESTGSKGNTTRSNYRFSCAVTEIEAALSPVTLGREKVLTRLADSLGMDDIQYELEEFNPGFNVKCKDARFASALLEPPQAPGPDLAARDAAAVPGRAVPRVVYDLYAPGGSG